MRGGSPERPLRDERRNDRTHVPPENERGRPRAGTGHPFLPARHRTPAGRAQLRPTWRARGFEAPEETMQPVEIGATVTVDRDSWARWTRTARALRHGPLLRRGRLSIPVLARTPRQPLATTHPCAGRGCPGARTTARGVSGGMGLVWMEGGRFLLALDWRDAPSGGSIQVRRAFRRPDPANGPAGRILRLRVAKRPPPAVQSRTRQGAAPQCARAAPPRGFLLHALEGSRFVQHFSDGRSGADRLQSHLSHF